MGQTATLMVLCLLHFMIKTAPAGASSCHRPTIRSPRSLKVNELCQDGKCNQAAHGEVCHCEVRFEEMGPFSVAIGANQVIAGIRRKLCWAREESEEYEESEESEESFFDDCTESVTDNGCLFDERIEICYEDNIDAAQALCSHFHKGGAFSARASRSRRPRTYQSTNRRVRLAKLKCPTHPRSLSSCSLEFLAEGSRCRRMVANCFLHPCWQANTVIRSSVRNNRMGVQPGQVRYGQACKLGGADVCSRDCFRCPTSWTGDSRDGMSCFSFRSQSGANQTDLVWE